MNCAKVCAGCTICYKQTKRPAMEPHQVEKIDSALLVASIRCTVGDFQRNLKFTTRLEHQIPIPIIKQEIYCEMPQYSVAVSNNRTIKLVFEKCNRCKLCHEIGNIEAIYSTPSTVNMD